MSGYEYSETVESIDEIFEGQELLLVNDVAKYLAIKPRTVVDIINRGELKALRVGRPWRIPRAALKNYIESASSHGADKSK